MREPVPSVQDRKAEPLDRDSLEVYRHLIDTAASTAAEISESTGLHLDGVTHSISALRVLYLVNPASGFDEKYIAVSPDIAKYQFIGPMIREIHRMESRLDDAHELFREAINTYESCARNEAPGRSIEALGDRLAVLRVIDELSANATMEVLISHPGGSDLERYQRNPL